MTDNCDEIAPTDTAAIYIYIYIPARALLWPHKRNILVDRTKSDKIIALSVMLRDDTRAAVGAELQIAANILARQTMA